MFLTLRPREINWTVRAPSVLQPTRHESSNVPISKRGNDNGQGQDAVLRLKLGCRFFTDLMEFSLEEIRKWTFTTRLVII